MLSCLLALPPCLCWWCRVYCHVWLFCTWIIFSYCLFFLYFCLFSEGYLRLEMLEFTFVCECILCVRPCVCLWTVGVLVGCFIYSCVYFLWWWFYFAFILCYILYWSSVAPFFLSFFFSTLLDKVSCDQISIGHGIPVTQKQQCTRLAKKKKKSVVVNKPGKVEVHITGNQSRNSWSKVAADHEFTVGWSVEPTKKRHNALWPFTILGHLPQPEHGISAVRMHSSSSSSIP